MVSIVAYIVPLSFLDAPLPSKGALFIGHSFSLTLKHAIAKLTYSNPSNSADVISGVLDIVRPLFCAKSTYPSV